MKEFPYPVPDEVRSELRDHGITPQMLGGNLEPSTTQGVPAVITILDAIAHSLSVFMGHLQEISTLPAEVGATTPLSSSFIMWTDYLDSLLSELDRYNRWARITWEHDPAVLELIKNGNGKKPSSPGNSGSESPEPSSQIKDETTGISEEYPFRLPLNILHKHVTSECLRLLERYGGGWTPEYYQPLALTCFETWAIKISEQKDTLYEVCQAVDSPIVWGVKHSLERLLDDFNDLLRHSRLTLPYDPWLTLNITDAAE
jgi:hypothetical protein